MNPATGARFELLHSLVLVVALGAAFPIGFGWLAPRLGLTGGDVFDGSRAALLTTACMGAYVVVGVVGLGLLGIRRASPADLGWRARPSLRDIASGLFGMLALVLALVATAAAFGLHPAGLLRTALDFDAGQRWQMLMIGVIAAAGEESVFRGYLQPVLQHRLGSGTGTGKRGGEWGCIQLCSNWFVGK